MEWKAPKYPIGTVFYTRGKHPRRCTVTDVWTTTNRAGDVVKVEYVAAHDLAGQIVTGRYPVTSIDMGSPEMPLPR